MDWNLFKRGCATAAENMAMDEALLDVFIKEDIQTTVSLYSWFPPAVTIGYAQEYYIDANPGECKAQGVDIVRRITGGGAVFHDSEITYSVVASREFLGKTVADSCREVAKAIIYALEEFGLSGEYAPENDVTVNGRKVSGSAQARRAGAILQHGTILLSVDRDRMFSLVKVHADKLERKKLSTPGDRVTSLNELTVRNILYIDAEAAMIAGFSKWLGCQPSIYIPSSSVAENAGSLKNRKYSRIEWNRDKAISD